MDENFVVMPKVSFKDIKFCFYLRLQLAEDMMQTSVALMKLCQSSNSYFRLLAAATLGTFYKITEKPKECIMILKNVVDNVGTYPMIFFICKILFVSSISTIIGMLIF